MAAVACGVSVACGVIAGAAFGFAGWRGDAPGRPVAAGPLGIANPVIVPGWAEAGLLIDSSLWEVTTATRLDNPDTIHRLLWKLLACAWLDTRDVYGIRSVGIYLAHHGVTMSWGLSTYASAMLGGTGREDTAPETFLSHARRLAGADGAEPPPSWQPRERVVYGH